MKHHSEPFQIFYHKDGTVGIKDPTSTEPMHSAIGPEKEAKLIYADAVSLARWSDITPERLIVWDVGLGIAANGLALLEKLNSHAYSMSVEIHSFENKTEALTYALRHLDDFYFLRPHEKKLRELLEKKSQSIQNISWFLHEGNFHETFPAAPLPNIIFYDFYSAKVSPELWTTKIFAKIRADGKKPQLLITYAASTAIRLNLLAAGFWVGAGNSTPLKRDTTHAATQPHLLERPLTDSLYRKILARWGQLDRGQQIAFKQHPQFANLKFPLSENS